MSIETNRTVIGGFVVGALGLALTGIMIFGSGNFFSEKNLYVLFFDGSVRGLNVGSPVVFRGVKIGSVKDIHIKTNSRDLTFFIPVFIEIEDKKIIIQQNSHSNISMEKQLKILIDKGLRAQLEMQSMVTGQLLVSLDFHPEMPPKISTTECNYPEIPTIQSELEVLTQKFKKVPIEEIFNKLLSVITKIETVFNSRQAGSMINSLEETITSTNRFMAHLDHQIDPLSSGIAKSMAEIQNLSKNTNEQILGIGSTMNKTIENVQKLTIDTNKQMLKLGLNMEKTINDTRMLIKDIRDEVKPLSSSIQAAARASQNAVYQAETTLKGIERITGRDSVLILKLTSTLNKLSDAARSFQLLADYLERHPEALVHGKK
ncbi:MAG: MlaD family protein [Thermodesulfobacteriota bacterium]|nr:MlaD family protein [Thermodesulfobacteriota bacterium]